MERKGIFIDNEKDLEKLSEEERKRIEREERRKQVMHILTALLIVSVIFFFISFLYEGSFYSKETGYPGQLPDFSKIARTRKPPVEKLYLLFPADVTGYVTKARHNTKYSQGFQAEAIYEPTDMSLQLETPMTVYCLLTAWDSESSAMKDIEKTAREYYVDSNKKTIGKRLLTVDTGYNQDRSRYFIGYQKGSFSLKTYAIFTYYPPVVKKDVLSHHGEKVAQEVINYMADRVKGE